MRIWKINCMEAAHPGPWYTWFTRQVAAVGWAARWGFQLRGGGKRDRAWSRARSRLLEIQVGDKIVVQLAHHRVGRVGEVTGLRIEDGEWDPTVPPTKGDADGDHGRLIHVRWDLTSGPLTPSMAVALDGDARFKQGPELRWTVYELTKEKLDRIEEGMRDEDNWVLLQSGFDRERWLSDHIAVSPHELEPGLVPYPWAKVREQVFDDRSRSDVLLLDPEGNPVVVECKQDAPTVDNLRQLRGYMGKMEKLLRDRGGGSRVRGVLVHGGPRKLREDVRRDSKSEPQVELVRYLAHVEFSGSN